jgi:hypothetical protein
VLEYFDKDGTVMDEFMVQSNGLGYYYAQFWLKAVPKKEGKIKEIYFKAIPN